MKKEVFIPGKLLSKRQVINSKLVSILLIAMLVFTVAPISISLADTVGSYWSITTIAGMGIAGYDGDGGPALEAELNQPYSSTVDKDGNVYVADKNNHCIRKIDTNGTVTTIAGTGSPGYSGDGGSAAAAMLYFPRSVAVGEDGNVYVADTGNERIRKINTGGTITTIAGIGVPGYSGDSGLATKAMLNSPYGIDIDNNGNVYIADTYNKRIRKVDTSGTITTIAGTGIAGYSGDGGPATSAKLDNPHDVAIDKDGGIFIADRNNNCIRKVDTSGTINTIAGTGIAGFSGDNGSATSAKLNTPFGVAVDKDGNVYIADLMNCRIRRVNTSGIITTIAGNGSAGYSGDRGSATSAKLSYPSDMVVDKDGSVLITDYGNNRIRKIVSASAVIPDPPTNVIATAGNAQATVIFTPPANDGGSPIIEYRATANSSIEVTSTATSITIYGLTNGASYSFHVTAVNAVGESVLSDLSNTITPSVPSSGGGGSSGGSSSSDTKLVAPLNLKAEATVNSINLSWDKVANAKGYMLYRKDQSSNFTKLLSSTTTQTNYSDTDLKKSLSYTYYVVAVNQSDSEGYGSNQVTASLSEVLGAKEISFTDIMKDGWYEDFVANLVNKGIVNGYPDNTYRPNNPVTRAEFTKMLCLAMGWQLSTTNTPSFSDIGNTDWYLQYAETCKAHGAVQGYLDGAFKGSNYISRAEIAAIAARVFNLQPASNNLKDIEDCWAKNYITACGSVGIITGYPDGIFKPSNNATRAEVSKIIGKMLDRKFVKP